MPTTPPVRVVCLGRVGSQDVDPFNHRSLGEIPLFREALEIEPLLFEVRKMGLVY